MKLFLLVFSLTAIVEAPPDAGPRLHLKVVGPAKPATTAADVEFEIVLSTDEERLEFLYGSFSQSFGVYLLGPWGVVAPDPSKVRPENWMHQEHSAAQRIVLSQGRPFRTKLKLSDYFAVADERQFRPGQYQLNVKFFEASWKAPSPVDSGPVQFLLGPMDRKVSGGQTRLSRNRPAIPSSDRSERRSPACPSWDKSLRDGSFPAVRSNLRRILGFDAPTCGGQP